MKMPEFIKVYLDSSDYSQLSNPRASSELQNVRDRLLYLASRPTVSFVYSGAHISEMAPLGASYAVAANTRTDLLVKLCGRSTLISPDRLVEAELNRLKHRVSTGVSAITNDGTWFPDVGQILSPTQQIDTLRTQLHVTALERGLNRKQRRFINSRTIKGGQLRTEALKYSDGIDMDEILAHYPMRQDAAEVIKQYVLGKVSAERADQAFLESLRDPIWMMRWFHEHHDRLSPIGNWLRGPALKIADQMIDIANKASQALRVEKIIGQEIVSPMLTTQGWKKSQDEFVVNTIKSIAGKMEIDVDSQNAEIIDQYCPGISTCIRVMHSSLRNSIGDNTREPTDSDFIDAVHAMYAPYVTFFRADRYMAPIIATHAEKYGATITRLGELPDKIEAALSTGAT